jgi:hypothetical protein
MDRESIAEACPTLAPYMFQAAEFAGRARTALLSLTDDEIASGVKLSLLLDFFGYFLVREAHARYFIAHPPATLAGRYMWSEWGFCWPVVGVVQIVWTAPLIAWFQAAGKKKLAMGMGRAGTAAFFLTPVFLLLWLLLSYCAVV